MKMIMVDNPGPGTLTEVHSSVEAMGMQGAAENSQG